MVAQVRQFNRLVTQRVGALEDHYLTRSRPLGEARVLWEIGDGGCDVRSLRSRLELDSGYLSRLLRSLEAAGLVNVGPNESDRRVRTARLTPAGVAERGVLDRRSDELARSFLEPLGEAQRPAGHPPWPRSSGCSPPPWSTSRPWIRRSLGPAVPERRTSPRSIAGSTPDSMRR